MKKYLIALAVLGLISCSSDDEQPQVDSEVAAVLNVLNGKFCAEQYSSSTNATEHWDYTFTPYAETKDVSYSVKANGTTHYEHYFNDHMLGGEYDQYYAVTVSYKGAEPTIHFYNYNSKYGAVEKEYTYKIRVLSPNSFTMDGRTYTRE